MLIAFLALALLLQNTAAAALDFRVDFRSSTYQTQVGDTFPDLLAQHESETLIQSSGTQTLGNILTSAYASGVTSNYSMLMTTTINSETPTYSPPLSTSMKVIPTPSPGWASRIAAAVHGRP